MKTYWKFIIFALLVCAAVAAGWFWYTSKNYFQAQFGLNNVAYQKSENQPQDQSEKPTSNGVTHNFDISTWKTYRNEYIGIEFKYPPEWGEINEIREQSCLNFSEDKRRQLLEEDDACLHIALAVDGSVFFATETPLATKQGFPRGGDWSYKKGTFQSRDFCNNNPYTGYKLQDCRVFKTKNDIKVTSGIQYYPYDNNITMVAYYIHTTHPIYSDFVLSSNNLLAPSYLVGKKKYVSDESEMELLIGSMRFLP